MMINRVFAFCFPIILLAAFISVFAQKFSYEETVMRERQEKDKSFRKGKESPLPKAEKRKFKGLTYFPVDSAYKVQARLVIDTTQPGFRMKTSTSRLPVYRKYGTLHFMLKGTACILTVYQSMDLMRNPKYHNYLFLPFTDATTDETTYGAGRYMDLRIPEGETLLLDFNRAYNPYCAYSDQYSCPITPAENRLSIAVEAGEKTYEKH
jgi:uncharacterized protein (DUF1684 family)